MLCSATFTSAIENKYRFIFTGREEVRFRNIKSPVQVSMLMPGVSSIPKPKATDPVCHNAVDLDTEFNLVHDKTLYHFCSDDSILAYNNNPGEIVYMHHHG